jgi:hypothetical protein
MVDKVQKVKKGGKLARVQPIFAMSNTLKSSEVFIRFPGEVFVKLTRG